MFPAMQQFRSAQPFRWAFLSTWSLVAAVPALHFAGLAALKLSRGIEGELLWLCNAGLGLAAIGLLIRSKALVGAAFINVAGLHAVWMADAVPGLISGTYPLGFTAYLAQGDMLANLSTSHHVYLCPLLWLWLRRHGGVPRCSFALAAVFSIALIVASRVILPTAMNVNFAHAVLPGKTGSLFLWANSQPISVFLAVHCSVTCALFLVPAALLARLLSSDGPRPSPVRGTPTAHHAIAPARARVAAFTLIELIAVLVLLAVLAGIAVPRYIDYTNRARQAADEGALGAIRSSLHTAFLHHRANSSPSNQWITSASQVASTLESGSLPLGITVNGTRLQDSRGNLYNVAAETATTPALLTLYSSTGGNSCS